MSNNTVKAVFFLKEESVFLLFFPLILILPLLNNLSFIYFYLMFLVLGVLLVWMANYLSVSSIFFLFLIILSPFDRKLLLLRSSEMLFFIVFVVFLLHYSYHGENLKNGYSRIPQIRVLGIMLLTIAISSVVSLFLPYTFSISQTIMQVERWGIFIIIYIMSYMIHNDKIQYKITLIVILAMGIVFSLFSIKEFVFSHAFVTSLAGVTRVAAIFSRPNAFSAYLELMVFIPLGFFLFYKDRFVKYLNGVLFLLIFLTILLTFTRGALIGLGVSVIIICIFYRRWLRRYLPMVILVILLLVILPFRNLIFVRFTPGAFDTSLLFRFILWKAALAYIVKYPFLGIGAAHFDVVFAAQSLQGLKGLGLLGHAHNAYLEMALGKGIFVAILFIVFKIRIIMTGVRFLKSHKSEFFSAIVFGSVFGLISISIHEFFDYFLRNFDIAFLYWILIGMIAKICSKKTIMQKEE